MSDTALYERPAHPTHHSRQILDRNIARPGNTYLSHAGNLTTLPYDILLNIASLLDVPDVVALQCTCTSLYASLSVRSVWLALATNLLDLCRPLPVYGFQRLWELDSIALSKVIRRGHHLQSSWTSHTPRLKPPYKVIDAPESEDIVWLSPITSKYTLCCTKSGKVLCYDVVKGTSVAEWNSGDDWEIWKCRVEFDERIVYFAMARRVQEGTGAECQLMALTFPAEVGATQLASPTFKELSTFQFPGHVISVYLLDPLRRLLSAYIWIDNTNTLGLYVLLDWDKPMYTYFDTGIVCESQKEWSCIGYDPLNVVIHAEEYECAEQYFYPLTVLRAHARPLPASTVSAPSTSDSRGSDASATSPPSSQTSRRTYDRPLYLVPPRIIRLPFRALEPKYAGYWSQSAHFVRQWWPTLPRSSRIRRRSCTIVLLAYRVPEADEPDAADLAQTQPELAHLAPGTCVFTIAQHYFSIPLRSEQLRWWYVREPFDIVFFAHDAPDDDIAPVGAEEQQVGGNAGGGNVDTDALAANADAVPVVALPQVPFNEDALPDDVHAVPLIAVDFGCAVWLEYGQVGGREKRLRFVSFPPVDADRVGEDGKDVDFDVMGSHVRTLEVPDEVDLGAVCHIGVDQAQGNIILGLTDGKVYIMRFQ